MNPLSNRRVLTPLRMLGLIWLPLLGFVSCARHESATKPPDVDYYTCTMHPSVKSQDPNAKCPICSMDLVPVMKKGAHPQAAPPQTNQANLENMPGMSMSSADTNA